MTLNTTRSSKRSQSRLLSALLETQRRILESIATGAPLRDTLEIIVHLIEAQADGMLCALLLTDPGGKRLSFVAAPNIPEDYKQNMEPFLEIGPGLGTCATAAFLRQPVYTRDTTTDPLWKRYVDVAVRNGVRAAWSTPILADEDRVLGTFVMFYGEPRLPADEHVELIEMATQLARVAIEGQQDDDLLRLLFDDGPCGIVVTDMGGYIVRVNQSFAAMLGHSQHELRSRRMAEISIDDPSDLNEQPVDGEASYERRYRRKDGQVMWARERSSLRRDERGEPRFILTHVEGMSSHRDNPLGLLSSREVQVLKLVVSGCASKDIGSKLGIAAASVDTYRSRIMVKLGVNDLANLVRLAIRLGVCSQ